MLSFEKRCGKWNLHPSFVAGLAVAGSDWHRSSVTQFAASESTDYKAGAECAVIPLPPCPKHIQHWHRSPAGDHGGHHSIPFLHSGSPNLDLPQLQQLRRYLLFLEPQSLGFSLGPGDLLLRFKLHPLQGVLRLESLLDRSHLRLDGFLESWRELKVGDGELHNVDPKWLYPFCYQVLKLIFHLRPLCDQLLGVVVGRAGFDRFLDVRLDDAVFIILSQVGIDFHHLAGIQLVV